MTQSLTFPSGGVVSIDETRETVRFRAASGACFLVVQMTEKGPILSFAGAEIELAADKLSLRAEQLSIEATDLSIASRNDLRVSAGRDLELAAPAGGIALEANDDVDVRGERVRLNCDEPPMPHSWDEVERRLAARSEVES